MAIYCVALSAARRKHDRGVGDKIQVMSGVSTASDEEAKADYIEIVCRSVGDSKHGQGAVERNILPEAETAFDARVVGERTAEFALSKSVGRNNGYQTRARRIGHIAASLSE